MALSKAKIKAALMLVQGEQTIPEIAKACGVGRSCVHKWKGYPEFQAEMARQQRIIRAELDAWRDRIVHLAIADRVKRMECLQGGLDSLDAICAARAADPAIASVPGGSTGLVKADGRLDHALLHAKRAILEQAAVEMGDRARPSGAAGASNAGLTVAEWDKIMREPEPDLSKLSDEELRMVIALSEKAKA